MPELLTSKDTKNNFARLMNGISRMQNGEVSKILSKMGVMYRMNYGVSIPHLRQLVMDFTPNNELAFLLWNKDIRETKILASMLFEADYITLNQAVEIGSKIKNIELVEQFSKNFFAKLPFLPTLMEHWKTGNDWEKMLALYAAGWHIRQQGKSVELLKTLGYSYMDDLQAFGNNQLHQSLLFVLQSLSMHSEMLQHEIIEKAANFMKSDNCSVRRLGEEFLWLNAR